MTVLVAEPALDVGALWRRFRFPTIVILIGLGLITLLAAVGASSHSAELDPRNPAPDGSRALATLLTNRGDSVTIATALPQLRSTPDATTILSDPNELTTHALHVIAATTETIVVIEPEPSTLTALGVPATLDFATLGSTVPPGCDVPAAVTAGSVRISGALYAVKAPAVGCYSRGGDAALVRSTRPNGATTYVFGSPSTLTNGELAKDGNAALAIQLLDTHTIRWAPGALRGGNAPKVTQGLVNLLPDRVVAAVVQLLIALIVLALWRARRLGRPVVEPLPVVVRAAETVEGRARLMRAARARDTAGRSLRAATIRRLSGVLRLGADEAPAAVVALVSERSGMPAAAVTDVLYGGDPSDDPALVDLAQQLPRLEAAIRTDDTSPGGQS